MPTHTQMNTNTLITIMKYLKQHKLQQSYLALQNQSHLKLYSYPKQIQFLRKLILKGDFKQTLNYLSTIQSYINEQQYKQCSIHIYRQWVYQLIESPNQNILKNIFEKQLLSICQQDQYQKLFAMLTCRKVNDLQGLSEWTTTKGRLQVFQYIVKVVQAVLGYSNNRDDQQQQQIDRINLDQAMALYLQYKSNNKHIQTQQQNNNNPTNTLISPNNALLLSNSKQNNNKQQQRQSIVIRNQSNLINNVSSYGNNVSSYGNNVSSYGNNVSSYGNNVSYGLGNNVSYGLGNNVSSYGLRSMMYGREDTNINNNNNNSSIHNNNSYINHMNNIISNTIDINNNISTINNNNSKLININNNLSRLHQQQLQQPQQINQISQQQQNTHSDNNTLIDNNKSRRSPLQLSSRKQQIDNFYHNNSNISNYNNKSNIIHNNNKSNIIHNRSNIHNINKQQQLSQSYLHHQQQQSYQHQLQSQHIQLSQPHIQYLQQTNSIVYNNQQSKSQQHFTFSQHQLLSPQYKLQQPLYKPKIIKKLTSILDPKAIRTCQFSNSGDYFALGTNSSVLKIFNVNQLYEQNVFNAIKPIYQINNLHTKSIFCLDWAQDQQSIVTCSNDLTIKLTQFTPQYNSHNLSVIGRHQSCIRMVKYSKDQQKIFSSGDDGLVKVWDMGKVKRCYNLKGHSGGINAFKLCQDNNQLYSVSKDATIKRWDLRSLQCIATSKSHQSQITYIATNTQKIVVSNKSGNVLFYDNELNLQYEVKIHEQEIRSIQAKKNEDLYITASFDGNVALFGEKNAHQPDYFQHNDNSEDKVVFATFLDHPEYRGFASTSTLGLCHIYSYT